MASGSVRRHQQETDATRVELPIAIGRPHRLLLPDAMSATPIILCATHRLVRRLQGQAAAVAGVRPALPATTLTEWLARLTEEALLLGRIDPAAGRRRLLGSLEERLLWRRVIETALGDDPAAALLDVHGLADSAADANVLVEAWGLAPSGPLSEETRQFLLWRKAFHKLCRAGGWLDPAAYLRWQVECIEAGACPLPAAIQLAGFDRLDPLQERLIAALRNAGVDVSDYILGEAPVHAPQKLAFPDADAELRSAAAWARAQIDSDPLRRVGIVVPDLGARRENVRRILDDTLDPRAIRPALAEVPRRYNLSLGVPLGEVPLVAVALALLRIAVAPWRIVQPDLGHLLNQPYWSADQGELAGRAQLDALVRETLPFGTSLEMIIRRARKLIVKGVAVKRLANALEAIAKASGTLREPRRPSAFASLFLDLLKSAGWPGERPLSSHEFQAVQAFREALARLGGLDELVGHPAGKGDSPAGKGDSAGGRGEAAAGRGETASGRVAASEALAALGEACRDTLFQPKTEGNPRIQVLGLLEAALEGFDALWVSGMTDQTWPPPARPNPLLPARLQREARTPHASPEVQAAFAQAIYTRLCRAAPQLYFSAPRMDGERELRESPFLTPLPLAELDLAPAAPLAAALAATLFTARSAAAPAVNGPVEQIDDALAPPVAEHETVRGGTAILKAQAVCPAWAFYRYRLQAKALKEPVEGLDRAGRGTLAHKVLEKFWQGRSSAEVFVWSAADLQARIDTAVAEGLLAYEDDLGEPLPPAFRVLEGERLAALLASWVKVERGRGEDFTVEACEAEQTVDIHGISARVVVDRIDRLADGRKLILDYKTGRTVSTASWRDERISEPQLPIYASYALAEEPVAAVAFAHLAATPPKFVGIAEDDATLPGVKSLAESRKAFPEEEFADWPGLLAAWQAHLAAIADEIRAGRAEVRFANENALTYSEILPLLRLAERRAQFERRSAAGDAQ